MSTETLFEELCTRLEPQLLAQPSLREEIRKVLDKNLLPQCNKCGKNYEKDKWGATEVSIRWGYESTGKDGDLDTWSLCRECSVEFEKKFEPMCACCQKSVIVAMAELSARNPHCSFFGDLDAALAYHREGSDWECAKIKDRIFCENCYEKLILSFQVPVENLEYMISDPEMLLSVGSENPAPRINRVERAMLPRDSEQSISVWASYDEAVAIRKSPDKNTRFLMLSRTVQPTDFLMGIKGDGTTSKIYIGWLEGCALLKKAKFNLSLMTIKNEGKILSFGEFEVDSDFVTELF